MQLMRGVACCVRNITKTENCSERGKTCIDLCIAYEARHKTVFFKTETSQSFSLGETWHEG